MTSPARPMDGLLRRFVPRPDEASVFRHCDGPQGDPNPLPLASYTDRHALWQAIAAYPLAGERGVDLASRLVAKQGWARPAAEGVVLEYRRFCFLACIADFVVVPSAEVDEVWHLHMLHSRDYWDGWCAEALGLKLHHEPAASGDGARFRTLYAETLALYETCFGPPPEACWPGIGERFSSRERFRTIDETRVFTVPRPSLRPLLKRWLPALAVAGLLGLAVPAGATALGPLDWSGPVFLSLYLTLFLGQWPAMVLLRRLASWSMPAPRRSAEPEDLDLAALGYLVGGKRRARDAALVGLIQHGVASYSAQRDRIVANFPSPDLPPSLRPYYDCIGGNTTRAGFFRQAAPLIARLREDLIRRRLLVPHQRLLNMALPLALCLFGTAKIVIGIARDRPVGILVSLVLMTALIAGFSWALPPLRSRAGTRLLYACRHRYGRAARAPRPGEFATAVALTGVGVLASTELAGYARAGTNSGGNSGGSCGSGNSCSSGGGDSGSGCGGCSSG
jgi:uncharacterized protein (TIGR04222 family)